MINIGDIIHIGKEATIKVDNIKVEGSHTIYEGKDIRFGTNYSVEDTFVMKN